MENETDHKDTGLLQRNKKELIHGYTEYRLHQSSPRNEPIKHCSQQQVLDEGFTTFVSPQTEGCS